MASSVSYMKGLRTGFLNTLINEIKNGTEILSCETDKSDIDEYLVKVTKCIEKSETYCCKLESQTERLAEKIDIKTESEFIEHCIDENATLFKSSVLCCADLKHLKEWLTTEIVKIDASPKEKVEFSDMVTLQKEMQK